MTDADTAERDDELSEDTAQVSKPDDLEERLDLISEKIRFVQKLNKREMNFE